MWQRLKTGGLWFRPSPAIKAGQALFKTPSGKFEFYSTGIERALAALAEGDTLRSAADLKVPMLGVTLLHRKGYFTQGLGADGGQSVQDVPRVEAGDVSLHARAPELPPSACCSSLTCFSSSSISRFLPCVAGCFSEYFEISSARSIWAC